MVRAQSLERLPEGSRDHIILGVVGHDGLDPHPVLGEGGRGVEQEPGAGLPSLIAVALHVGNPRAVIDGGVDVVVTEPSQAPGTLRSPPHLGGSPEHPPTAAVGDAPQFLHVQVQQLSGAVLLVADGHPGGSVGVIQAGDPVAGQHPVDRGAGPAEDRLQVVGLSSASGQLAGSAPAGPGTGRGGSAWPDRADPPSLRGLPRGTGGPTCGRSDATRLPPSLPRPDSSRVPPPAGPPAVARRV